jgi:hypothetical protein
MELPSFDFIMFWNLTSLSMTFLFKVVYGINGIRNWQHSYNNANRSENLVWI